MKSIRTSEKLISLYQFISTIFPSRCRFYPSCSVYAKQAFQQYGFNLKSIGLVVYRLLRCQPFSSGGLDPLPKK